MCLCVSYEKEIRNFFFTSLTSLKKGVGPGVGPGSISQRYGSEDPDPHQNVTDPLTLLITKAGSGKQTHLDRSTF
jgi:hypothetical protein